MAGREINLTALQRISAYRGGPVSPCKFWGWGLGSFTMDTLQPPETLRNPQVGRGGVRVGAVPLASTSPAPISASGASAQALAHAGAGPPPPPPAP